MHIWQPSKTLIITSKYCYDLENLYFIIRIIVNCICVLILILYLQDPFLLNRCIINVDREMEDIFEVMELNKESCLFKVKKYLAFNFSISLRTPPPPHPSIKLKFYIHYVDNYNKWELFLSEWRLKPLQTLAAKREATNSRFGNMEKTSKCFAQHYDKAFGVISHAEVSFEYSHGSIMNWQNCRLFAKTRACIAINQTW